MEVSLYHVLRNQNFMRWNVLIHLKTFRLKRSFLYRDSTIYGELYGISEASTIIRGTLRYKGYTDVIKGMVRLGLLSPEPHPFLHKEVRWISIVVIFKGRSFKKVEIRKIVCVIFKVLLQLNLRSWLLFSKETLWNRYTDLQFVVRSKCRKDFFYGKPDNDHTVSRVLQKKALTTS